MRKTDRRLIALILTAMIFFGNIPAVSASSADWKAAIFGVRVDSGKLSGSMPKTFLDGKDFILLEKNADGTYSLLAPEAPGTGSDNDTFIGWELRYTRLSETRSYNVTGGQTAGSFKPIYTGTSLLGKLFKKCEAGDKITLTQEDLSNYIWILFAVYKGGDELPIGAATSVYALGYETNDAPGLLPTPINSANSPSPSETVQPSPSPISSAPAATATPQPPASAASSIGSKSTPIPTATPFVLPAKIPTIPDTSASEAAHHVALWMLAFGASLLLRKKS